MSEIPQMARHGLKVDTGAEVTAAVYDVGDRHGIVLGEGSIGQAGGGKVTLALSPESMGERRIANLVLYRWRPR
ncbi:MAG: hypothetical protein JW757_02755 [Anaerolineales bacterium]|nr:hypothetical protein [Anaerolineales bacterium]